MLEATVTLNLGRMLQTDAGMHHVEMHMEKEYSKENLLFWQQCRNYRTVPDRCAARHEACPLTDMCSAHGLRGLRGMRGLHGSQTRPLSRAVLERRMVAGWH